jgi:hypothetical protein
MSQQVTTLEQETARAAGAGSGLHRPERTLPRPTVPTRADDDEPAEDAEWNPHAHCRVSARFLM